MSAAAVRLSRNSRTAMGGFHPWTIVAGGKTAGSIKQGGAVRGAGRSGAPYPAPAAALGQTRPLGQLEAGVNPRGARARGRGGTGGLAGRWSADRGQARRP